MGFRKRLKEAILGKPTYAFEAVGSAVLGKYKQTYGVRLTTSFKDQMKVYNKDPVIKESIIQFAQQVISTGIFTTIKDDYKVTLPTGPDKSKWNAKECVDAWNKRVNLDAKILQITIESLAFGNSLWHNEGFVNIPIESIDKAERRTKLIPIADEYNLRTTHDYGNKVLNYGLFTHFRTGPTGYAPFGSGTIIGLVATPDDTVPSFWELRKSTRKAMLEGFEKFSFGNELWIFEGMSDDKIEAIGKKVTAMDSTGQRVCTNVKGDIKLAIPQRTQSYDKWLEATHNEFLMALANPSLKLGLEQGFTKATAVAASDLFKFKIASMQRVIRREIEKLWLTVLNSHGFDARLADPKLHFGSPEVEYETGDLFKAIALKLISKVEARKILRDSMKWRIEEELPEGLKTQEPITDEEPT